MRDLKTQNNYLEKIKPETRSEPLSPEIITEPNQSFTLREILEQYTRGSTLPGRDPIFEDPTLRAALGNVHLENLNKIERAQLNLDLKEYLKEEEVKTMAKRKKAEITAFEEKVQARVKEALENAKKAPPAAPVEKPKTE